MLEFGDGLDTPTTSERSCCGGGCLWLQPLFWRGANGLWLRVLSSSHCSCSSSAEFLFWRVRQINGMEIRQSIFSTRIKQALLFHYRHNCMEVCLYGSSRYFYRTFLGTIDNVPVVRSSNDLEIQLRKFNDIPSAVLQKYIEN